MFILAQEFLLRENIIYQDKQSSIKIEKNGRMSSSQKTKHMSNKCVSGLTTESKLKA